MEWQPMETAPKDGTVVLLLDLHEDVSEYSFNVHVAFYDEELGWLCYWGGELAGNKHERFDHSLIDDPTHWMHLPPPPS